MSLTMATLPACAERPLFCFIGTPSAKNLRIYQRRVRTAARVHQCLQRGAER
jgi:hypothetical protein